MRGKIKFGYRFPLKTVFKSFYHVKIIIFLMTIFKLEVNIL